MAASFRTIIYLIPFPIAFLSQTDSPAVISLLIIYAVLPMKIIRIIIWKITKENILCVLILAAVFLPQLAESIAFADFFHNLRVVCQDHAAAAFLCRPF